MRRLSPRATCRIAGLALVALIAGLLSWQRVPAQEPDPTQVSPYLIEAAYPAWRRAAYPFEQVPLTLVGRISHAAVWPDVDGTLVVPDGFIMPELIGAAHAAGKRVVLAVGGAARYFEFAAMTADPSTRAAFVQILTAFVVDQGYDGVEIDWEFPQSPEDSANLTNLVSELHAALVAKGREPGLTLCVASGPMLAQWIDAESLTPLVDYYLVMAYNQYSAASGTSGHSAALYPPAEGEPISVDTAVRYWTDDRGVPSAKVLLGVPFFGNSFDSEDLYRPFTTFGQAYYSDIAPLVGVGFTRHWDATCRVPYLTEDDGPLVWSYDDAESIGAKCDYVVRNGLAGVAIWDISGDLPEDDGSLLGVIAERLGQSRSVLFVPMVSRPAPTSGATEQ
jgi:chitinase